MDVTAALDTPCTPEVLFGIVEDLSAYPAWLSIVPRAETVDGRAGTGEALPAWSVDLRGKLGPLARSKRLRMERVVHERPFRVRFERREQDGRSHSPWVLTAEVEPVGETSRLVMTLHYGGSFGGNLVERLLSDEIESSKPRLLDLVDSGAGEGPAPRGPGLPPKR